MKSFNLIASTFYLSGLALLAISACSISGPLRSDPKAERYRIGALSQDWKKQGDEEKETIADAIYLNSKSSAYISMNSMCRRYADSSLENLTNQLLAPLSDTVIETQEKFQLDEREALLTKSHGTLDGVPVEARFVVMRKNECIFDFSIVSRDRINPIDEEAFSNHYKEFKYLGGVKE